MNIKRLAYSLAASLTLVAGAFSVATPARAAVLNFSETKQVKPLEEVYIKDFAYAGTGCPAGSAASLLSSDKRTLEILFDSFQANLQPSSMKPVAAFPPQTNCSVSIKLHVPAGWSATWHRVEHRGFADTSGNARGELRARYYIPGAGGFDELRVFSFQPKMVRDYTVIHDAISTAKTQCSTDVPMTVNTRIRLTGNPTGYNALTVDSISKKVTTTLFFRWERCNQ